MLSDNIALREAAIASQSEAERWRSQYGLADEVRGMKERLEWKMKEVSVLVDELGGLPEKAEKKGRRRKSTHGILGQGRSPTAPDWRNRQTIAGVLSGATAEQEGRLPPIVEDKLFPRRTLEPLEIQNLVDADGDAKESESPDLGPPPIAHFDVAEPIEFKHDREAASESPEDMVPLPSNLETRRKRRTSSLLRDMTTSEGESDPERSSLFKSGAKRKLDVSELEDNGALATSESEKEDFVFQRRPALKAANNRKSSRFSRPNPGDIVIPATNGSVSPQKARHEEPERRVLGPKSTNSPSKRPLQESGKSDPKKAELPKRTPRILDQPSAAERPPSRKGGTSTTIPPRSKQIHPAPQLREEVDDEPPSDLPPKTPFLPSDILSPTSSEPITSAPPSAPSTSRPPSEAAIINSVEDVLNGSIGRGSRRARAAVSYAEPSLRDKMRRPGKELVGAVEGLKGSKREGSIGNVLSRSTSEDPGIKVKREESVGNDEKWRGIPLAKREKEEPGSPLSDKKAPPVIDKEGELQNDKERDRANAIRRHAQARKAIQDADFVKARDGGEVRTNDEEQLRDAVERLSIFDPPASSPSTHPGDINHDTKAKKDAPAETKRKVPVIGREAGRRHSMAPSTLSMPASAAAAGKNGLDPSKVLSNLSSSTSTTSRSHGNNVGQGVPRPSSAASIRAERTEKESAGVGGMKRSTSVVGLKGHQQQRNQTNQHLSSIDDGRTKSEERNERVATRRRSMMV